MGYVESAWVQRGALITGERGGGFGRENDIKLTHDGSRIAIGAWAAAPAGDQAGQTRVYDLAACGPTREPPTAEDYSYTYTDEAPTAAPTSEIPEKEVGWCVKADDSSQIGAELLYGGDVKTPEELEACLSACMAREFWTGCQAIWDQFNRGCWVHTLEVDHGNLYPINHACWINGKDDPAL